jgi:hypothetical protein
VEVLTNFLGMPKLNATIALDAEVMPFTTVWSSMETMVNKAGATAYTTGKSGSGSLCQVIAYCPVNPDHEPLAAMQLLVTPQGQASIYTHTYIHTYIHTHIHTCIHDIPTYIHTYTYTCTHTCIHTSGLSSGSEDVDDDHAAMELDAVLDAAMLPNRPLSDMPGRGKGRGRLEGVPVGQRQQEPAQAAPARGRGGGRSKGKGRSGARGRGGRAQE